MTNFTSVPRTFSPYQLRRRRLLGYGLLYGALAIKPSFASTAFISNETSNIDSAHAALDAVIDVLIPADAITPSASALGISAMLLTQAETDAVFKPWLIEGMKWLDQGVQGSFVRRNEEARTQLITQLASAEVGSQQRIFFELLRVRTMTAYYADPRSGVGLAIDRPPQPIGYPDFADAE